MKRNIDMVWYGRTSPYRCRTWGMDDDIDIDIDMDGCDYVTWISPPLESS